MSEPTTMWAFDSADFDCGRHSGWSAWWSSTSVGIGRPVLCFTSAKPSERWLVDASIETLLSVTLDPLLFDIHAQTFTGDLMSLEQAPEFISSLQEQLHSLVLGTPVEIFGSALDADVNILAPAITVMSNGSLPVDSYFADSRLIAQCAGLALGVVGHNPHLVWSSVESIVRDLVREQIFAFLTEDDVPALTVKPASDQVSIMECMAELDSSRTGLVIEVEVDEDIPIQVTAYGLYGPEPLVSDGPEEGPSYYYGTGMTPL